MPFAREFRPLGGWRRIESQELSRELDLAASGARRVFSETVRGLRTTCQFEVIRGSLTATIEAVSRSGDIVIIAEPVRPADHAVQEVAALLDAALRSASAVMLVPRDVARQSGTVVAIAGETDDPAIPAAAAIAACAGEDLIILETVPETEDALTAPYAEKSQMNVTRMPISAAQLSHAYGIRSAFRLFHERLVVIKRGAFAAPVPSMIASIRHVPVLIIGT